MARITLQVIDGADRGILYGGLETPITIGREEGNTVQLNDERISRFHVKIQEDQGRIVLTDLESTNGTRVNGRETQLRILQFGDLISVGRSTLLFGTRDQIAERVERLKANGVGVLEDSALHQLTGKAGEEDESISIELDWGDSRRFPSGLHLPAFPELPEGLSPAQAAQVSELIEYLHQRVRGVTDGVAVDESSDAVAIDQERWQDLLDLQSILAQLLRRIGDPGRAEGE